MIDFHLDMHSGVAPYLQIVRQVRQALLLGLLAEGDKLPTVKEVVAKVAINPNTVSKAYRELEHQGLAAAKPGVGHLHHPVTGPGVVGRAWPTPRRPARLAGQSPRGRSHQAGHRSLDFRHPPRRQRRGEMTALLQAHGLGKRYGSARRWPTAHWSSRRDTWLAWSGRTARARPRC